jgi:two-component system sensor histidine kinase YesM
LDIDPSINIDTEKIPNMIIQPNVENAIWHGLRYRESMGLLQLKFSKSEKKMKVIIEDNGIGLEESKKIKTKNQKLHTSLGLQNVRERIRLLNDIYKSEIHFEIIEKTGMESGVQVQIEW